MEFKYFPDEKTVKEAMQIDNPMLMLVFYDGLEIIIANIDDAFEHVILLRKVGLPDSNIDKYFRLVVNQAGADWTFVCPRNYRGITDEAKRINRFYLDGINAITKVIEKIGYRPVITIPSRYRRHFNKL